MQKKVSTSGALNFFLISENKEVLGTIIISTIALNMSTEIWKAKAV